MDKRFSLLHSRLRPRVTAIVMGLMLFLTACGTIDPSSIEQLLTTIAAEQPTADSTTPSPATTTGVPSDIMAETPLLMCTPPACGPDEVYYCPDNCPGGCGTICATPTPVTGAPTDPAPPDWEGLAAWLTAHWRAGTDPAAVRTALQQSGRQESYDDWRAADFDGDLRDEWVLVLHDPSLPTTMWGYAGDLWIINGNGPIFRHYLAPSDDIYNFIAPTIIGIADMTGDGRPELITDVHSCGAHTCFGNYRILSFIDNSFRDLVRVPDSVTVNSDNQTISQSFPDVRLVDSDSDGLLEFLVHGGTIGSAGAGITRPSLQTWGWDGSAVTLTEVILDPTDYRHHILYEANDLMAAGDLEAALLLYEAAINDTSLRNDGFWYEPEPIYQSISQFAAFRLILIDLLRGAPVRASERLAWLQGTYPDSAAARGAGQLVAGWSGPDGMADLCDQIEGALDTLDTPTGSLADMGYGNPSLSAADYCP